MVHARYERRKGMQKRKLGSSGLEVSAMGLGCIHGSAPAAEDKQDLIALIERPSTRDHILRHG
jgi:hypothetical protein